MLSSPPSTAGGVSVLPSCEERLALAESERDKSLTQLAEARAELDALKRAEMTAGEPDPPLYPNSVAAGLEPPLRYLLVDALNAALKRLVGPAHRWLKGLF